MSTYRKILAITGCLSLLLLPISGCSLQKSEPETVHLEVSLDKRIAELMTNPEEPPLAKAIDGVESEFLYNFTPEPAATVSLSDNKWGRGPAHQICVAVYPYALLRVGDDFSQWDNIALSLDDQKVEVTPYHLAGLQPRLLVSDGILNGKGPPSDPIYWPLDIEVGMHLAEVKVWTSRGEEFYYAWAFEVVR